MLDCHIIVFDSIEKRGRGREREREGRTVIHGGDAGCIPF